MDSKRIYILGAGSSIGHSKGVFPTISGFFSSAMSLGISSRDEYNLIASYAQKVLGRNILSVRDSTNIEAFFTHIEIELERKTSSDLLQIRTQLLKLIQSVLIKLGDNVSDPVGEYNKFVSKLDPKDTIITFNWDILLDNVLHRKLILDGLYSRKTNNNPKGPYWQFILDLSALGEQTWKGLAVEKPYSEWNPDSGYYLKAHGSIDWFYCSNDSCRGSRKVFPLLEPDKAHYCSGCHEILESLLVPPVLNKEYRKYPFIRRVWNLAAKEMSTAQELIVWGYSLPPTDFHSTWLFRQARETSLKSLVIINPDVVSGKEKRIKASFIRNFYDIFRDKISKDALYLYESYDDYHNGLNILNKYGLGDSRNAYKSI